jgi:hypothetical protein
MKTAVTRPDGSVENFRSYQRMCTALDQWCAFRNHTRVVAAIRNQRALTYQFDIAPGRSST